MGCLFLVGLLVGCFVLGLLVYGFVCYFVVYVFGVLGGFGVVWCVCGWLLV